MNLTTSGQPRPGSAGQTDCYVPKGKIGQTDLRRGCYTAAECFWLAAQDLAARGLAEATTATLRSRGTTVRALLAAEYGVVLGVREYYTPSHQAPDEADAWEFLRMLRRAVRLVAKRAA